jgi:hypothetical protein
MFGGSEYPQVFESSAATADHQGERRFDPSQIGVLSANNGVI